MPTLNTPQRIFLAAIGAVVILLQLYRFADDGIEGVGWVFSFLVAALLLLPAVGLIPWGKQPMPVLTTPTKSEERLDRAKQRIEALVLRAVERAKILHRRLPILIDLPPLQAAELKNINSLMTDSWLQYCIAFTGCLSIMTEFKKLPQFMSQPDYRVVWQMLVNEIAKAEMQTAVRHGLQDKYDMERSLQWAARDMSEGELAMKKFIDRLAENAADSDMPLIEFLMNKMGAPEQTRAALIHGVRPFVKETLQQFYGQET